MDFGDYMKQLKRVGSENLKKLIDKYAGDGHPVTCLVYTFIWPWVAEVAREINLPSAFLVIQSATAFAIYHHLFSINNNGVYSSTNEINLSFPIKLPELPLLFRDDIPSFLLLDDPYSSFMIPVMREHIQNLELDTNPRVLINTFNELEEKSLKIIDKIGIYSIGPLIPSVFLDGVELEDKSFGCDLFEKSMHKHINVTGTKILPDWGYGRVYTVLVVNCTFPIAVSDGGKLLIHATTNGGGDSEFNVTDTFLALTESEKDFTNFISTLNKPPKYDFLYCGSSLYGNLSPQRVREWLAFHVRLFGVKSHFVFHDAGGVHEGVMAVLKPWMEKGYVTLQDIRDQERFDGYYHNQFLIVNDCLHKYRFQAKWMFFFDVDEFIFVPKKSTIKSVVDSLSDYTQFTIEQMPMSNKLCLEDDRGKSYRKWGFEKLVYKDVKRGIRRDRKYAVQPRNVIATGVHMSQNTVGKTTHKTEGRIKYFHYHGTIAEHREPCRQLVNATMITVDQIPYEVDSTMRDIAGTVKRFELKMIGSTLQKTRQ